MLWEINNNVSWLVIGRLLITTIPLHTEYSTLLCWNNLNFRQHCATEYNINEREQQNHQWLHTKRCLHMSLGSRIFDKMTLYRPKSFSFQLKKCPFGIVLCSSYIFYIFNVCLVRWPFNSVNLYLFWTELIRTETFFFYIHIFFFRLHSSWDFCCFENWNFVWFPI